jgi:hypothetical protein
MSEDYRCCGITLTYEEMKDWGKPVEDVEVLGIDVGIAILESLQRIEKHLGIVKEEE